MALCKRQCPDCPMRTTVLVCPSIRPKPVQAPLSWLAHRRAAPHRSAHAGAEIFYAALVDDSDNDLPDLSIILHAEGRDLAARCPHADGPA